MSNNGPMFARRTLPEDTSSPTETQTESGPADSDVESDVTDSEMRCPAAYDFGGTVGVVECSWNQDHDRIRNERKGQVSLFDHGNPMRGGFFWNSFAEQDTVQWQSENKMDEYSREPIGFVEEIKPLIFSTRTENPVDMVNHPPHYQQGGMEVIDVLQVFFPEDPLLWQVGKYIMRAGKKGDIVEDLEKAAWYLARRIEELKNA